MKNKKLSLIGLSILTLIVFLNFTSAVSLKDITEYSIPANVAHDAGSFTITFNLTNQGAAGTLNWNASTITSGTATISFNDNNIAADPAKETITATISFNAHQSGNIGGTIDVIGQDSITHKTLAFSVPIVSSKSLSLSSQTIPVNKNSTTLTITNKGNTDFSNLKLTASGDFLVEFDDIANKTITSLIAGNSQEIKVTILDSENLKLGSNSATITATANDGTNATGKITIDKTYCRYGEVGSDLKITEVKDNSAGDEWDWAPLKEIELKINVENNHATDSKRVTVKIGLYNTINKKFVYLTEEDKELEDTMKITDGGDENFLFNFKLPADLDMEESYRLYVKAYEKGEEETSCISNTDFKEGGSNVFFQEITVDAEEDVGIDGLDFLESVSCGTTHTVVFNLYNWNLGDGEEMRVRLYNKVLGIDVYSDSFELDEGESAEDLSFEFNIPKDATEGNYKIAIIVEHDYRSSSDTYRASNTDNSFYIKVQGNCKLPTPTVLISANLASGGKAGEELLIKVTLTNTGDKLATYTLGTSEISWASLVEFDQSSVVLDVGKSKEVLMKLQINKDVSGEKTFNLKVSSEGEVIAEQPISVSIEKSITGFSLSDLMENNLYLWVIGALNIILIIVIILVAVRVARK